MLVCEVFQHTAQHPVTVSKEKTTYACLDVYLTNLNVPRFVECRPSLWLWWLGQPHGASLAALFYSHQQCRDTNRTQQAPCKCFQHLCAMPVALHQDCLAPSTLSKSRATTGHVQHQSCPPLLCRTGEVCPAHHSAQPGLRLHFLLLSTKHPFMLTEAGRMSSSAKCLFNIFAWFSAGSGRPL